MNITLTPDIEQVLRQAAKKQGSTVESIVLKTLRECFFQKESGKQERPEMNSLADMLKGDIGTIDSGEIVQGGARMSEKGSLGSGSLGSQGHWGQSPINLDSTGGQGGLQAELFLNTR